MSTRLPEELLVAVHQQILLRQAQLQQLSLYYNAQRPTPSCLIAFGPDGSNKYETIKYVLDRETIEHVTINCRECLSQRHLLTKIFARFVTHLRKEALLDKCDRLDNINALASNLRRLLSGRESPLVLVLLSADQQRGATPTLLPALARLGELIPCLAMVFTSSSPHPLPIHRTGVPYIHFPPYQREEAIQVLLQYPLALVPNPLPDYAKDVKQEKVRKIYNQFATVLYDTLIGPTTTSVQKYRETCEKLWPRFIWPLIAGERLPGKNALLEWDFARLLGRNRVLFQSAGEEALQEQLVSTQEQPSTFDELVQQKRQQDSSVSGQSSVAADSTASREKHQGPLLKYLPTLLLLSAYLASHTHPKHDIVLFSRLSNASSTNRRKKKYLARSRAGGITKTPTKSPTKKNSAAVTDDGDGDVATPSKKSASNKTVGMENATPKKERADRSMRAIFEKTLNIARPFTLERVIAILRAIHPDGIKSGKGIADRVYSELGELERLRLVVRNDPKAAGKGDAEEIMEEKWKCIVGRDWVVEAGKSWGVSIEGWEVE